MKQLKHLLFAFLLITTVSIQAQVGIGITTPAASAQLDVSSTTKGFLPPRMTTTQRNAITTPVAAGLTIYNTTIGGIQIYNGTTWNTASVSPCGYAIGQNVTALGGIIFYLDASGCHGLVCAPTDQSTGIRWDNGSFSNTTAYADCVGGGGGNTTMIIFNLVGTQTNYAAGLARAYGNDWYLPSKYELNLMYKNIGQGNALGLGNVGGFANNNYWSSTEYNWGYAFLQNFTDGARGVNFTYNTHYVRAVSAF